MKKILVVNYQMLLGGVCIAAKNFIENMKKDYIVEYMLAKKNGDLDNRLPQDIKISYIPQPLNIAALGKKECLKEGGKKFLKKTKIWLMSKIFNSSFAAKKLCEKIEKNESEYDLVINNDMDMSNKSVGACHVYTKYLVKAKIKALVIHGDFVANGYDRSFFEKEYIPAYDYIIVLSNGLKKQLDDLYPKHKHKFIVIPNFEAVDEIKKLSVESEIKLKENTINIVSASRLTKVKGIMRSLKVFKRLKNEGYNYCWYILGMGEEYKKIKKFILKNELSNNVKLMGLQKNPYPYFKAADILFLGSYHESYGLVLIESMILGKPVLTTNTISAKEIVSNDYGWICENSEEGIYETMKTILSDTDQIKIKTKNLKYYNFDNTSIKEQYKQMIGD